jgi:hypothetical protein
MNRKLVVVLASAATALSASAPAMAQVTPTPAPPVSPAQPASPGGTVVPPSQPATPGTLQPPITAHIGSCVAKTSTRGYSYAVCPVVVENFPYDQSVLLSYSANMRTFTPRTHAAWNGQTGTLKLSSGGSEAGDTTTITGKLKFAFPKAKLSTVKRDLKVTISARSASVFVSAPTAVVSGS